MGLLKLILEANTPNEFVEHLKNVNPNIVKELLSITSFKGIKEFADKNFEKIGSGSSRGVYGIDEELVLKLALNGKGVAQNEIEDDISGTGWHDEIIAKVYLISENNRIMVSEYAKPYSTRTNTNMEKVAIDMGITQKWIDKHIEWDATPWTILDLLIRYIAYRNSGRVSSKDEKKARTVYTKIEETFGEEHPFFELEQLESNFGYGVSAMDFNRADQWGKRKNGDPVLIDYGFTDEVRKKHYS